MTPPPARCQELVSEEHLRRNIRTHDERSPLCLNAARFELAGRRYCRQHAPDGAREVRPPLRNLSRRQRLQVLELR